MNNNRTGQEGQSLVEFALIVPILLIMMLGVFEVGWALRGYLTLTNANREAARFASRGVYLDLDQKDDTEAVGYSKVITHTLDSLSSQLNQMNFINNSSGSNASIIITYYSVQPRAFICPGDADCATFDCDKFLDPAYDGTADEGGFDIDGLNDIEYPILNAPPPFDSGYTLPAYYNAKVAQDTVTGLDDFYEGIIAYHYHRGGPYFSQIDPRDKVEEFRVESNHLNCELKKKGLPESNLKVVLVENLFEQELLVGLPLISRFIGDTVPMYTHTAMRINPSARVFTEEDEEACNLYPLMIPSSRASGLQFGELVTIPIGATHDVAGNMGYIQWNSSDSASEANLSANLLSPSNAGTAFQEPGTADTALGIGDWILAYPGAHTGTESDWNSQINTEMLLPVWNDADCLTGPPCVNATGGPKYRVSTFAKMILTGVDLSGAGTMDFQFLAFDSNACPAGRDE